MVEKNRAYKDLKTGEVYFVREIDIIFQKERHCIIANIYNGETRLVKESTLKSTINKDSKEVSRFKLLVKKKSE